MKIEIDAEMCSGHGRCQAAAPELYKLDYDGYNEERGRGPIEVPPGLEKAAEAGEWACPESAITRL